jgi:3-oxoacyl-[acyl-carrier-protein] synthase II
MTSSAARPRIAVTGVGVVAPGGTGEDEFWRAITASWSHAELFPTGDDGFNALACPVTDGSFASALSSSERRRLDRIAQLGLRAADDAVGAGGMAALGAPPERIGLVVGIGFGGGLTLVEQIEGFRVKGRGGVSPFGVAASMPSTVSSHGAIRFGIRGPVLSVTTACASGATAIIVVAGGAEAPLHAVGLAGFHRLDALSRRFEDPKRSIRPFDEDRDGMVLGEGAGFVVLTTEERARRAGVPVRAVITGWSMTSDAFHITAPDPEAEASARCVEDALRMARCSPADVGHVNAHGTATRLNDVAEARAYRRVFGAAPPPVTSLKGAIGHLVGGAGAVEFVGSVLALDRGAVPPTANCDRVDPEVDLDVVAGAPRPLAPAPFISSSFAFGGVNTVIVAEPPR